MFSMSDSIDNAIEGLLQTDMRQLSPSDLVNSRMALQLSRINLSLRAAQRMLKLLERREAVQDRLYDDELIQNMGFQELMMSDQTLGNTIDAQYKQVTQLCADMRLDELEVVLSGIAKKVTKTEESELDPVAMRSKCISIAQQLGDMNSRRGIEVLPS